MKFSLIPLLFAMQIITIFYASRYAMKNNLMAQTKWISALLVVLILWGATSLYLALNSVYVSEKFLSAYPTFWLPFIPVVLVVTLCLLFSKARYAVRSLIDATSIKWIVGIHILRILAIGTLIKAQRGEFSMSFATWVGIPDLLFGLSALLMLWFAVKDRISNGVLLLWNLIGVLVILPAAPIVGQMGLPGMFHSTEETPSMVTLYEFPMVLAPSLVVPIFVMINLFVAIRLMERMIWGEKAFV